MFVLYGRCLGRRKHTCTSSMIPVLQWTPIKLLGQLIYNCIMVIINNLSLMFCVGIAAALAKKNKQQAAIIGLMSYFTLRLPPPARGPRTSLPS